MTLSRGTEPELHLPSATDASRRDQVAQLLEEQAAVWLADLLPGQRWFGDKTRRMAGVEIEERATTSDGDESHVFLIVTVMFHEGPPSRYFVPLAFLPATSEEATQAESLATVSLDGQDYRVVDGFASRTFRRRLLEGFPAGGVLPATHGSLAWGATASTGEIDWGRLARDSRLLGAEQSNTSVVYGDSVFLKAFRKLQAGVNPDLEVGRFLTARTSFRNFPVLLGEMQHQGQDGSSTALAMVQAYAESVGDAWSITLQRLRKAILLASDQASEAGSEERDSIHGLVEASRNLGRRTGQLHAALASVRDDDAFSPESITTEDAHRWSSTLRVDFNRVLLDLEKQASQLPQSVVEWASTGDLKSSVESRLRGFEVLVGYEKTRVHGDYHLGQVLWTRSNDFVILDFEGEPARPLEERRRKTSPLKDVAGMLRSFAYAGAVTRLSGTSSARLTESLTRTWEEQARDAFLHGYRDETVAKGARFVPSDAAGFTEALSAWELDKVVYEIHYELNNRPDWLYVPLEALHLPSPQAQNTE